MSFLSRIEDRLTNLERRVHLLEVAGGKAAGGEGVREGVRPVGPIVRGGGEKSVVVEMSAGPAVPADGCADMGETPMPQKVLPMPKVVQLNPEPMMARPEALMPRPEAVASMAERVGAVASGAGGEKTLSLEGGMGSGWEKKVAEIEERAREVLAYRGVVEDKKSVSAGEMERVVGVKWVGWVGALVMVVGTGLGIKYAYDQGWLGGMPVWVRMILFALGAFGLIGAGEWTLRRVNRLASAGLFAAGVAGLFVIAYAGHAYYGLYSPGMAFGLMAMATVVGSVVAGRADLVSIAVLTLVGALLSPMVVGEGGSLGGFLVYLLAVQGVALVLAGRGGTEKWWVLRLLSLVGNGVWVAALVMKQGGVGAELLAFAVASGVLAHGELVWSAMRGRLERVPREATQMFSAGIVGLVMTLATVHFGRGEVGVLMAAGVCAAMLGVLAWVLRRRKGEGRAAVVAVEEGARGESVAALLAGVFLGLPGDWVAAGLIAVAVAMGAWWRFGVRVRSGRVFSGIGAAVGAIGAVGMYLVAMTRGMDGDGVRAVGFGVMGWASPAVRGLGVALVGLGVARLLFGREEVRRNAAPTEGGGMRLGGEGSVAQAVLGVMVVGLMAFGSVVKVGPVSTMGIVAMAWGLGGLAWVERKRVVGRAWGVAGLALVGFGAVKWAMLDVVGPRMDGAFDGSRGALLVNLTVLAGVAVIGSLLAAGRVWGKLRSSEEDGSGRVAMGVAAVAMGLTALLGLEEIDRAMWIMTKGRESVSSWWMSAGGQGQLLLSGTWLTICSLAWGWIVRSTARAVAGAGWLVGACASVVGVVAVAGVGIERVPVGNVSAVCVVIAMATCWVYAYLTRRVKVSADAAVVGVGGIAGLAVEAARMWRWVAPEFGVGVGSVLTIGAWVVVGAMGMWGLARVVAREWDGLAVCGAAAHRLVRLAGWWVLVLGLVLPWVGGMRAGVRPVVNAQAATAVLAVAGLVLGGRLRAGEALRGAVRVKRAWISPAVGVLIGALVFVGSSIEVARVMREVGASSRAVMAGYSAWWALLAISAVGVGFAVREKKLRFAGLGLFGVTLVKVWAVDLAAAGSGMRIVSLFVLGGLMLATSVLYGKLAPVLLGEERAKGEEGGAA